MPRSVNWKIAGVAGNGILSVGELMARALSRSGYQVFGYMEYPSLIRGGHNTFQVWADESGATAPKKMVDVMIALNQDAIDLHKNEFDNRTILIKDPSLVAVGIDAKILDVEMNKLVSTLGDPLVRNTVALGLSAAEMALNKDMFTELITETYGKKKELLELNLKAFEEGFKLHPNPKVTVENKPTNNLVLDGNKAVGLGAIAAGIQFYAGYPMTPVTNLLHFLAEQQEKYGFIVRQTEDEISAINMVIGAAYAGAKVMTATSGGGFDLMQEGMSLAGMLEVPIVVNLGMRPGPATGLPTWTSQSDLRLAIHSGHGEYPKIILAPGDAGEAYELSHQAFFLAQKFQVPVILLTDKHLNESEWSVSQLKTLNTVPLMNVTFSATQPEAEMFHRYQPTNDGISDRTLPGVANGFYIANSDEHSATGILDEGLENREANNRRRLVKIERIRSEMAKPSMYGPESAKWTIVGWGSTKGAVLQAMKELNDVNFVHITNIWPLPVTVGEVLTGKQLIFIENNLTGQLMNLVKQEFGISGQSLLKDDGRPFYPEEIIEFVKKLK